MNSNARAASPTLFGHPTGLFTLFFAEMWERFSYYGMRALLVFYMTKGFLGYGDDLAYSVYGFYTALLYMTPFFGGMIADRILGQRRAIILGGTLMALGHLAMTLENKIGFYFALALIITGNGFFKPNISSMVGTLYPDRSPRRDGGFTIFYMGINLGAAMAPLLCGYIGETYGWHWGFGLATAGMLIGLAVFVVPNRIAQIVIGIGALAGAYGLFAEHPADPWVIGVNIFTGLALLVSAGCAMMALDRAGLPAGCGAPPSPESLTRRGILGMPREMMVYVGALVAVPVFTLFVSGFSFFTADGQPFQLISAETVQSIKSGEGALAPVIATVVEEVSKPAGLVLFLVGLISLIYLGKHIVKLERIARHRMIVAMILIFFSMLFWAFFEQAGSSINNFTDRNVDRMTGGNLIAAADVGKTIELQPTQGQLGFSNGPKMFTLDQLDELRAAAAKNNDSKFQIPWTVAQDNVGMLVSNRSQEIPASTFQSVNAICVLIFGLVLTALWTWMAKRRIEPSTPLKFALGLLQVGLGFYALVLGAQSADGRGMVAVGWLVLGYALHTTGELCVSPVGLSMVTKLSPKYLVSTVMGTWFLATAFSQYLASIISIFTSVKEGGGAGDSFPTPIKTLGTYSDVFLNIAVAAGVSAVICLALVPLLKSWMHEGEDGADAAAPRGGH